VTGSAVPGNAVPGNGADAGTEPPLFAVAKGEPTPEELAALTAVVLALGSGGPAAPEKPSARQWIRRQQLQLAPKPGPGSWRRSRG
jgi:hypothetical protein